MTPTKGSVVPCTDRTLEPFSPQQPKSFGGTPIHSYAKQGRTALVKGIIARGTPVDTCDRNESTALHIACGGEYRNAEMVDMLIGEGADVNRVGNVKVYGQRVRVGVTPIQLACADGGDLEIVRKLVAAGADVRKHERYTATPLSYAIEDNIPLAKYLIENGAKQDIHTLDGACESPLGKACRLRLKKAAEFLLKNGADPNTVLNCIFQDATYEIRLLLLRYRYNDIKPIYSVETDSVWNKIKKNENAALMDLTRRVDNLFRKILELITQLNTDPTHYRLMQELEDAENAMRIEYNTYTKAKANYISKCYSQ